MQWAWHWAASPWEYSVSHFDEFFHLGPKRYNSQIKPVFFQLFFAPKFAMFFQFATIDLDFAFSLQS